MDKVKVDKAGLIALIQANMRDHRDTFEMALAEWQRQVTQALERAVEDARNNRNYRTYFQLPQPEDHSDDYESVLGMLNMHVDDTIELTMREYRNYVEDNWEWKPSFTRTTDAYLVG